MRYLFITLTVIMLAAAAVYITAKPVKCDDCNQGKKCNTSYDCGEIGSAIASIRSRRSRARGRVILNEAGFHFPDRPGYEASIYTRLSTSRERF